MKKEMISSLNLQATQYFSAKAYSSSQAIISENDKKPEATTSNVEEAESTLCDGNPLNHEEARALLGRYEYQKGNIEVALRVFEGLDIAAATPKMKISLSELGKPQRRSHNYAAPPFSINTVSLLLETTYLKSKSLQHFGRYKEAAESCRLVLDIIESSLPEGLPKNLGSDQKIQETLNNAVEFLPELWQLAGLHQEAILSFRRALLCHWNFDKQTTAKIQKQFAVFLLYSGGGEESSNIEEAILLLMILLRKISLKKIEWDPCIIDHLSYALSICSGLESLGKQIEELLPGIIDDNERCLLLALCCYGQGDSFSVLNLLKNMYKNDSPHRGLALLLSSKIFVENSSFLEAISTAKRAIHVLKDKCDEMVGVAYSFLGVSFSADLRQFEALESLERAGRLTRMNDSRILYDLGLENAKQRKLGAALGYVKLLINLEGGSHLKGWILLARILSAQKLFEDGESIINAALNQTGKWDQGELLRTKAKLQIAQGQVKQAVETYTQLLAVLQVQCKSSSIPKRNLEVGANNHQILELETWNDLAMVYISLSQWDDADACLSKSKAINNYSASTRHTIGLLYEAKGLHKQALKAYKHALDADPTHVPSLVSIAGVFKKLGGQSGAVARSFLNEALQVDRMNSSAWYNLGLVLKDEGPTCAREAADCFEAAIVLKETEPIEPFI